MRLVEPATEPPTCWRSRCRYRYTPPPCPGAAPASQCRNGERRSWGRWWNGPNVTHPFARTLATPRTYFALNHPPRCISRQPSIRICAPTRGSRPPIHRLTQWTADILSPSIRILSPTYWGATLASTVNAHAVNIMASSSKTIMDRLSLPCTWARRLIRVSSSKSIFHHNPVSTHNPPIVSPDASLMRVREWGCHRNFTAERPLYQPAPDPLP